MDTTETTQTEEAYQLSSEEKKELLDSEVAELSNTLSGYQMNSELKKAWISTIVPPSAEAEGSPSTTDEIAVEFMLPSEDTFWETFNFPDKRWPEGNEFRQFIESLGFYSPDNLPEIVGTEVDVEYDESMSRWSVQGEFRQDEAQDLKDKDGFIENLDSTQKGILLFSVVVGIPLSFILLVRLRQFSLPIIATGVLGVYLVLKD